METGGGGVWNLFYQRFKGMSLHIVHEMKGSDKWRIPWDTAWYVLGKNRVSKLGWVGRVHSVPVVPKVWKSTPL